MSDDSGKSKKLSLSGGGKLTLGGIEAGAMRASTPGAGRRTVQVEVRRKRAPAAPHRAAAPKAEPVAAPPQQAAPQAAPADADDRLTAQERAARVRALQEGMKKPDAAPSDAEAPAEPVSADVGSAGEAKRHLNPRRSRWTRQRRAAPPSLPS